MTNKKNEILSVLSSNFSDLKPHRSRKKREIFILSENVRKHQIKFISIINQKHRCTESSFNRSHKQSNQTTQESSDTEKSRDPPAEDRPVTAEVRDVLIFQRTQPMEKVDIFWKLEPQWKRIICLLLDVSPSMSSPLCLPCDQTFFGYLRTWLGCVNKNII